MQAINNFYTAPLIFPVAETTGAHSLSIYAAVSGQYDTIFDMKKVMAHLIISGRVQGVFFRASTQDTAERLGVSGWVRNLPDGSVETVFEGPLTYVQQAIDWCHSGPPGAEVINVHITWENFTGKHKTFEIRYGFNN